MQYIRIFSFVNPSKILAMSLKIDSALEAEMWEEHDTDKSSGSSLAPGTDLSQNEVQDFDSLPIEIDEICINEQSDHAQMENDLTMYDKMTMLQDTFKTVGGDLDEIKNLMFKLRDVLKTDGEEEIDCNKQRHCCSGESSNDVSVIEEDEAAMHDLLRGQHADKLKCPTRESSNESMDDSKYSTLIADIEVLKNKLASLKRNLAE